MTFSACFQKHCNQTKYIENLNGFQTLRILLVSNKMTFFEQKNPRRPFCGDSWHFEGWVFFEVMFSSFSIWFRYSHHSRNLWNKRNIYLKILKTMKIHQIDKSVQKVLHRLIIQIKEINRSFQIKFCLVLDDTGKTLSLSFFLLNQQIRKTTKLVTMVVFQVYYHFRDEEYYRMSI